MDGANILYIEINTSSGEHCLTLQSRICLFLLKMLQNDGQLVKIICVMPESCQKDSPVNFKCDENLPFEHISSDDCPKSVQAVHLPVLISNKGRMVHCGLSSVLRKLVKHIHLCLPSRNFISLLGHHEMCLRSCAEVSVWTKFCEVEMPQMLERLSFFEKEGKRSNMMERKPLTVPDELIKLEDHFHKAAIIPQITKRKRQIYEQVTNKDNFLNRNKFYETWIDDLNTQSVTDFLENKLNDKPELFGKICKELKTPSKVVAEELNVPGLGHDFAEGADVTLTDMVLLPSVSSVIDHFESDGSLQHLVDTVPCVIRWYQKLVSVTEIAQALKNAATSVTDLSGKVKIPACSKQQMEREKGALVKQKTRVSTSEAGLVVKKLLMDGIDVDTNIDSLFDVYLDWNNLPAAVHPQEGCLPVNRISRKCEQLGNLASAVLSLAEAGNVIVDFCAGGGHLGILLAYLLPDCHILLIENKEESIRRAMDRVLKLDLRNITLYQSNLDYFHGKFDIGTCLHACGVATDLVLDKCLQASASFVICPCCYGAVQNTQHLTYPQSQKYRSCLTYEEYLYLAHAADDQNSGKQFMVAVDRDRQGLGHDHGYTVNLKSLEPLTCSPKNNLLIGRK